MLLGCSWLPSSAQVLEITSTHRADCTKLDYKVMGSRLRSVQRPETAVLFSKDSETKAREMVQSLEAVALTEDQDLILRTHMAAQNLNAHQLQT